MDLFFLQIQGSGRVELENGEIVRVGYSDQNGHPYKSVGRLLVERGEVTLEKASMQGIKAWGQKNPRKLPELLQQNSSFVFFLESCPLTWLDRWARSVYHSPRAAALLLILAWYPKVRLFFSLPRGPIPINAFID